MELEPEILRDKAQWSVFGGADLVSLVMGDRVAVFVLCSIGQRDVEVDASSA